MASPAFHPLPRRRGSPGRASPTARRGAALAALAPAELAYRLRAGEAARVEEYLTRFPELAADPGAALELIATEYNLRRGCETGLTPESYLDRFPHYSEVLRQRLRA